MQAPWNVFIQLLTSFLFKTACERSSQAPTFLVIMVSMLLLSCKQFLPTLQLRGSNCTSSFMVIPTSSLPCSKGSWCVFKLLLLLHLGCTANKPPSHLISSSKLEAGEGSKELFQTWYRVSCEINNIGKCSHIFLSIKVRQKLWTSEFSPVKEKLTYSKGCFFWAPLLFSFWTEYTQNKEREPVASRCYR